MPGTHEEFTHHMACTDTGLKTCDLPVVLTLNPLVKTEGEETEAKSLDSKSRMDVNTDWNYSGLKPVEYSPSTQESEAVLTAQHELDKMGVVHSSTSRGQCFL